MQAESPPTQTRRRLYREPEEKKLAGVCAGLADHFGLDARLVRLGVIVLALTNGVGIIAYVLAAIVIPERPSNVPRQPTTAEPLSPTMSNALIVGLVLLAVITVGGGDIWWFNGPTVGLVLVGLGIWLLVAERNKPVDLTTPSAGRTTLPGEAASQSDLSSSDYGTAVPVSEPDDSTGPRGEVPPPVPPWGPTNLLAPPSAYRPEPQPLATLQPRQRDSALSAAVLGLLFVGGGFLALLAVTDVIDLDAGEWFGVVLLFVGVGMLVGAWWGRGRVLLAIGAPALALLLCGEAIDVPFSAGDGDRQIVVGNLAELRALDSHHEMVAGELAIDLSDAPLGQPGAPSLELTANVGLGELSVILPRDVTAEIKADVDAGELRAGNQEDSGLDVQRKVILEGTEGGGHIQLDLHVGMGDIEVSRV
jgi:phage shock protein PspC (stress-responsive transcriptional regulator)